jgi:dihydrofolate reductase
MIISLIVAVDEKNGIGKNNQLPWHLPSDLKRFKTLTMGHHLIMGRKTYATIARPLPGRDMIIVTRQRDYSAANCTVVGSLEEALQLAKDHQEREVFIIGGGEIFRQAIDLADKIYLTKVQTDAQADVKFPEINLDEWVISKKEITPQNDQEQYKSIFEILIRNH